MSWYKEQREDEEEQEEAEVEVEVNAEEEVGLDVQVEEVEAQDGQEKADHAAEKQTEEKRGDRKRLMKEKARNRRVGGGSR